MASQKAMEIAARCWCAKGVTDRIFDPELAEVFADCLDKLLIKTDDYIVRLVRPENVDRAIMADYITGAVRFWCKSFERTNPLFNLKPPVEVFNVRTNS